VGRKKRGEYENKFIKSNEKPLIPPWNLNKIYEGTMIALFFGYSVLCIGFLVVGYRRAEQFEVHSRLMA
jgi:hypothetical protein